MKILLMFLVAFALSQRAQSQGYSRDTFSSVTVIKDPRFDDMAAKQAEINKRSYISGTHRRSGFRVQAANTQNRDEANAVKAELLRRFPDQKSYLLYQAPNFRVRIGNFVSQKEALQLKKMISALYPQKGIYVVPDIVEYTIAAGDDDQPDK